MADVYLADVDLDCDLAELKGTANDLVMGTQPRDYTESKSAEQRANQVTKSFTDYTDSKPKTATEMANQNTGCCAKRTVNRRLCHGNSLKGLQLYSNKGVWHRHTATLLATRSWLVMAGWRHLS